MGELEQLLAKLLSLENLFDAIEMEGHLVGSSSCVLASAVQVARHGVPLGTKVVDIMMVRDIEQSLSADDMDDLALALAYGGAKGLAPESDIISVSLYPTMAVAVQKQSHFVHLALKKLMSSEKKSHLSEDVGVLLVSLVAGSIVMPDTRASLQALAILTQQVGEDISAEQEDKLTKALQVLESSIDFKDLLETVRGKPAAELAKSLMRQALVDRRCQGQLQEMLRLVSTAEARQKLKPRGQCCMVSIHENVRPALAPCCRCSLGIALYS